MRKTVLPLLLLAVTGAAQNMRAQDTTPSNADRERKGVSGQVPAEVLAAKTVGVYFGNDDEMAEKWVRRFLAQPEVVARFAYVPEYEKADIVLGLFRNDEFGVTGIPDDASTTFFSDGSVIGAKCYEKSNGGSDCFTYEGKTQRVSHWALLIYRGSDFSKQVSAPPGIDLPPPGIELKRFELKARAEFLAAVSDQTVKDCVYHRAIFYTDEDGITIGCEVQEFWNRLRTARNSENPKGVYGSAVLPSALGQTEKVG